MEQYTDRGSYDLGTLLLLTASSALRDAFLDTTAGIGDPLTAAIAKRTGDHDQYTARVLSVSTAAAVRRRPPVVGTGRPGPLAPALDAAERRPQQ